MIYLNINISALPLHLLHSFNGIFKSLTEVSSYAIKSNKKMLLSKLLELFDSLVTYIYKKLLTMWKNV